MSMPEGVLAPRVAVRAARWLFCGGALLRLLTFLFMSPFNNDGDVHVEYIEFILKHHWFPLANQGQEAVHPPLYYLLVAPFWGNGNPKTVQFISLLLSLGGLYFCYRLIFHTKLIERPSTRLWCSGLISFLPQFVMAGLFISNDALVLFLSPLFIWQVYQCVAAPTRGRFLGLVLISSAGLLTKGTFLPLFGVGTLLVALAAFRSTRSAPKTVALTSLFLSLAVGLGSFKYLQNFVHFGKFFLVCNDFGCLDYQRQPPSGILAWATFNFPRLFANVTYAGGADNNFWTLLYATFWYHYVRESSFIGNAYTPLKYIGSAIFLVALIPTFTFLRGIFLQVRTLKKSLVASLVSEEMPRELFRTAITGAFLGSVAMLGILCLRWGVWTYVQCHYIFPSLMGGVFSFSTGIDSLRSPLSRKVFSVAMMGLFGLFLLYFFSEYSITVVKDWFPGFFHALKQIYLNHG